MFFIFPSGPSASFANCQLTSVNTSACLNTQFWFTACLCRRRLRPPPLQHPPPLLPPQPLHPPCCLPANRAIKGYLERDSPNPLATSLLPLEKAAVVINNEKATTDVGPNARYLLGAPLTEESLVAGVSHGEPPCASADASSPVVCHEGCNSGKSIENGRFEEDMR